MIYVLENGKRKPVSRTTGLPVKNNLRKAQKILEDRKREYDEMGLAGMLSLEERDRFASMPLADYMRYVFEHKPNLTAPTKIGYLNTINGRIDKFFGPRGVTISSIQMKTESSRRTLPLIPYVKEELLRHKKQLEANRKAFRNGYSKKWLNCVCVDSLGNLIIPDKLKARFGNLLKANGLRHIRFHDLRHSCASFLVSSGIPLKQVQLFLGHSNYSTTADIYAHLSPNALDASGATMQSLLAPKAAETGKEAVPV